MTNQKQHALLCPNCRKLISQEEKKCPYCGMSNPGSGFNRLLALKGFDRPETFVKTIIGINIAMYIISLFINPSKSGMNFNPLTMLSPSSNSLLLLGATGKLPIAGYHRWWTLVTANYIHGGLLHIIFNMMAFRQICPLVIREFGLYRTMVIYTLSGVIGFYISYLAGVTLTIGASAAIFGLMGALIYYGKSRGGLYGQAIYKQVGGWVLGMFFLGLMVPVINNWGHGGGLLGGVLLSYMMGYREISREKPIHRTLAVICVLVTLLTLIWAIFSGIFISFFS